MAPNIDTTLAALITQHRNTPFAWGTWDCCQWALLASRQITGLPLPVPPYRSASGAARVLRAMGGYAGALAGFGAQALPNVRQARRGDVVLVPAMGGASGCALAICTGQHAHAVAAAGLCPVPMAQWLRAWRFPLCHK